MTLLIRNSQFAIRNCLPLIRNSQFAIRNCSQGFSLVELLVVIGIIAVLSGVLLGTFGGSSESAASARCLANMKNLATACQTYGMEHGHYPLAGSIEYFTLDASRGRRNADLTYNEIPGWISWYSNNGYPSKSHRDNPSIGMCSTDELQSDYALTNGALWKYVSGNRETYVCPAHAKKMANPPHWSYLMNGYFGWNATGKTKAQGSGYIYYGKLNNADKILLFSEVPFTGLGSSFPDGSGSGEDSDSVLQFATVSDGGSKGQNGKSGNEFIGFNHRSGKRYVGHVVFADGHAEKLVAPKAGMSDEELKNLTSWLCQGIDISFNGKKYDRLDK